MKLLVLLFPILLTGCFALNDYDRSLSLVGNVNEKTGAIEYSLVPAPHKGEGKLGAKFRIEGSISEGKQVIRLE